MQEISTTLSPTRLLLNEKAKLFQEAEETMVVMVEQTSWIGYFHHLL